MISAHEYPITANLIEIADMMILNRPLGWSICAGMPQLLVVKVTCYVTSRRRPRSAVWSSRAAGPGARAEIPRRATAAGEPASRAVLGVACLGGADNERRRISCAPPATAAAAVDTARLDAGQDREDVSCVGRWDMFVTPAAPAGWTW